MRSLQSLTFVAVTLVTLTGNAESDTPKWSLGAGFGYLEFENYPGASQSTSLALPFPTFQYRGDILRADDREGANIYIFNSGRFKLQLGGIALPPGKSSIDGIREGMRDLPAVLAIGPQMESGPLFGSSIHFKAGIYQANAFEIYQSPLQARAEGVIYEADLRLTLQSSLDATSLSFLFDETNFFLSANIMGASQEVQSIYYSVSEQEVTGLRRSFSAEAGIFQSQLSYFQSFKKGDLSFYLGARISDHSLSQNKDSPLHQSDHNLSGLIGFTYDLYRSESKGVSAEDAKGAVGKIKEKLSPNP